MKERDTMKFVDTRFVPKFLALSLAAASFFAYPAARATSLAEETLSAEQMSLLGLKMKLSGKTLEVHSLKKLPKVCFEGKDGVGGLKINHTKKEGKDSNSYSSQADLDSATSLYEVSLVYTIVAPYQSFEDCLDKEEGEDEINFRNTSSIVPEGKFYKIELQGSKEIIKSAALIDAENSLKLGNCAECSSSPQKLKDTLSRLDQNFLNSIGIPLIRTALEENKKAIEKAERLADLREHKESLKELEEILSSFTFSKQGQIEFSKLVEGNFEALFDKNEELSLAAKSDAILTRHADFKAEVLKTMSKSELVSEEGQEGAKELLEQNKKGSLGRIHSLAQLSPAHPEVQAWIQEITNPYNRMNGLGAMARDLQVKCSMSMTFNYQACNEARFKYDMTVASVRDLSGRAQLASQDKLMAARYGYSGGFLSPQVTQNQWSVNNTPAVPQNGAASGAEAMVSAWFTPSTLNTTATLPAGTLSGTQFNQEQIQPNSAAALNAQQNVSYLYLN